MDRRTPLMPNNPVDGPSEDASVSVVICAYTEERWHELSLAVDSVDKQTLKPDSTILVIDHNSALYTRCIDAFPKATVIENEGKRGLAAARNTGIASSKAKIIAFLDDDARALPT